MEKKVVFRMPGRHRIQHAIAKPTDGVVRGHNFRQLFFDPRGYLIGTNARMMVRLQVEILTCTGEPALCALPTGKPALCALPAEAAKVLGEGTKDKIVTLDYDMQSATIAYESAAQSPTLHFHLDTDPAFPEDWAAWLPKPWSKDETLQNGQTVQVAMNAGFIKRISQALGTEDLVFQVRAGHATPVAVWPAHEENKEDLVALASIMPVVIR